MKKVLAILIGVAVASFAFATDPTFRTTALTPSAGTTGNAYDAGAEVTVYFEHTTTAALTNGQTLALARVPGQARLIDGEINIAASGVASTNTLGLIAVDGSGFYSNDGSTDADDTDGLLTAFATTNAVKDTFCNLVAGDLLDGKVVEKDVYIVFTGGGTAFPTNKVIKGVVRYIR
jgi:hypothetical protein